MSGFHLFVSTGLDPVAHAALTDSMDCRIKSGNDDAVIRHREVRACK